MKKEKQNVNISTSPYAPETYRSSSSPESIKSVEHKTENSIFDEVRAYNNVPHERDDNMNCDLYEGKARFIQTNRMRKVSICVFSHDTIENVLNSSGYYFEGMDVKKVSFPRPTERQIEAMKNHNDPIPNNVSFDDISAVMDRIIHEEQPAPRYLFDFAEEHRVPASYFSGVKTLHYAIWVNLEDDEKLGFFAMCAKKYKTGIWSIDVFKEYCQKYEEMMSNQSFANSFSNFLRNGFFGFYPDKGIHSNAYKILVND